jgi:quinolinate synthase
MFLLKLHPTSTMKKDIQQLSNEIRRLKEEKRITILAHYYQRPEIQQLADHVGDSLSLSQYALECGAQKILFSGVHFMAETAKIINRRAKILIPDAAAGCSLADSCTPSAFDEFLKRYPYHKIVSYINCSAEIKAMSDVVCTSSNAEKVILSIPRHQPIVFAPDKNLGRYLIAKTGRKLVLWDGACVVHESFSIEKLLKLHQQFPKAKIVAHPEAEAHLLKVAHFIGSTSAMISYVKKSDADTFIIATEAGILHELQKQVQGKTIIPAPTAEDNTCACSECGFMKMNTLEKIQSCMLREYPTVEVEESLRLKALQPLTRMLEISKN